VKPWRITLRWDCEPGAVVTTASSQPAWAALRRRAASRAAWTPRGLGRGHASQLDAHRLALPVPYGLDLGEHMLVERTREAHADHLVDRRARPDEHGSATAEIPHLRAPEPGLAHRSSDRDRELGLGPVDAGGSRCVDEHV